MLWKFPKKSLKRYFENIRTLVNVLLRDEFEAIKDHCYFAIALMEQRFPVLATKIFKFMEPKF